MRAVIVGLSIVSLMLSAQELVGQVAPAPTRPSILCSLNRSPGDASPLVVDLRLRSGDGNRAPTAAESIAVVRAGGRVLRAFHVALLRAAIDTGGLRRLLAEPGGIATVAYPVDDTASTRVWLQLFYNRRIVAEDTTRLAALGASGFWWSPQLNHLSLTAPDSLVERLATLADVRSVRAQAMACANVSLRATPPRPLN